MKCSDAQGWLSPYLDGELTREQVQELEGHLQNCANCTNRLESLKHLSEAIKNEVKPFEAPDFLHAARLDFNRVHSDEPGRSLPARWPLFSGGIVTGLAAALILFLVTLPRSQSNGLTSALVSDHVRSLMSNHLVDVPSSNLHTVKPWFLGKLDFSPPVPNLDSLGFPLIGGRLEYIDGHAAAGLVYRRAKHIINVLVMKGKFSYPAKADLDGYHVRHWRQGDLDLWAVSDVEAAQLDQFVQEFQKS